MTNWRLRGLVFAAAMVVVRLLQGALINAFPTQAGLISIVLVLLLLIAALLWGLRDGRADASAEPDPDRRQDLAMTWLLAGLTAGIVSGAVVFVISLLYKGLYAGGLLNELTTFAAFTALLVFLPAMAGVAAGRWLIDRHAPPPPKHEHREDDTDVFDAVHEDETPTEGMATAKGHDQEQTAGGRTEERPSSVATAEGEEPTRAEPTQSDAEQTRRAPRSGDDQR
ncbi:B-4DMT family transporter [Mycobacterium noviomagense]|uniref:Transmembrane protein n=1 Tax=Mycobacterium noviomagense TaxID=459858 RepID=A0A7I7PIG5_9MYCO|nr:B-4DMT family transporter [Mycobacterium noviomagense]ORB17367.1 hypothetical protein BST37_04045 [Mycobacterium noviomagense]BBY08352.1 hypothetical protein MNVI_36700 [Mycobacterium noviomagense]